MTENVARGGKKAKYDLNTVRGHGFKRLSYTYVVKVISLLVEPQVDGIPVVRQSFFDATVETRVQRQRRLVGLDGRRAGRRDRVVRTETTGAVADTTTGTGAGAARAYRAAGGSAVRGRVSGITVASAAATADFAVAPAATAAVAVAPAPAPGAVPAAFHPRYALRIGGGDRIPVRPQRVVAPRPHGPRYAVLVYVDDALLDR